MNIDTFLKYKVGNTPIYRAVSFCPTGNLFLKLEQKNPHGSIKERAAYFILRDLIETDRLRPGVKLVESSSGNLGFSLGSFAKELEIDFLCLIDPSVPPSKVELLLANKIWIHSVSLGNHATYRDARIQMAQELESRPDWIWTRQYDNPSNVRAHFETTGPEIWSQMTQKVDYIVCSVGSGGTVCGIGLYMKQQDPNASIIAVEPKGSTIFGGEPGCYLSVGAGMSYAPGIIQHYGEAIDYFCQVSDADALAACKRFYKAEGFQIGVTTGSVLVVASHLAVLYPDKRIIAVAPDGGEKYVSLFDEGIFDSAATKVPVISRYVHTFREDVAS